MEREAIFDLPLLGLVGVFWMFIEFSFCRMPLKVDAASSKTIDSIFECTILACSHSCLGDKTGVTWFFLLR